MSYARLHNPVRDTGGDSSAVISVLFSTGPHTWQETKQGSIVFSGEASGFHEWEETKFWVRSVTFTTKGLDPLPRPFW